MKTVWGFPLIAATFCLLSCVIGPWTSLEITDWSPREETLDALQQPVISVSFARDVELVSVESAFSLTEDGVVCAGRFDWEGATVEEGATVVFSPSADLSPGREYRMTVSTRAEDRWGNSLAHEFCHEFRLGSDTLRPEIDSVEPEEGSRVDSVRQPVTVTFSESVDRAIFYEAFSISPDAEGTFAWSDEDTVVTFTPLEPLEWQQEITVRVDTCLADLEGNTLAEATEWTFTPGTDTEAPSVLFVGNESEDVALTAGDADEVTGGWVRWWGILVRFSEPVDNEAAEGCLLLEPETDTNLQWLSDKEVLISPAERFTYAEVYTLRVSSGVADLYSNTTSEELSYRFRTDGETSAPIGVTRCTYWYDTGGPLDILELAMYDTITVPAASTGFFDLYMEVSQPWEIDLSTFAEGFSISTTNTCADIFPYAMDSEAILPLSPHPAPTPGETVVRVHVDLADTVNQGMILLRLSSELSDTGGNRLSEEWVLKVHK